MRRKEKKVYIFVTIVSLILYSVGVVTGIFIQKRSEDLSLQRMEKLRRDIESSQLEYFYLTSVGEKLPCSSLSLMVNQTTNNVWEIGEKLVGLEGGEAPEINELKKEYSILSVRAWLLNNYLKEKCDTKDPILLYFYSVPCPKCVEQGNILDKIREEEFRDMKIFVLDIGVEEPIIEVIKDSQGINETPSLIIENRSYTGILSQDEIRDIIKNLNNS